MSSKNYSLVGKIPNDRKVTHFYSTLKPVQSKGRRVPLHLLAGVNEELKRMETEGHIIKLEKCDEDCFISPIVITQKGCFDQTGFRLQIIKRPNF